MATHEFQPDGSVIVTFEENGTSIALPSSPDFQMDPTAGDWHEYVVPANIPTIIQSSAGIYLTREDVERALLQQSAPEWRDFTNPNISPDTALATTGSFTDTLGPGQVIHTVSENGSVIINQTLPGHPFHPGIVARTVVENADGSFTVLSYGIGNTDFSGGFGEFVADANFQAGMALFSQSGIIFEQAKVNAAFRTGNECFGPEVPIDMWPLDPEFAPDPTNPHKAYDQAAVRAKVWTKPIEQIEVGDIVVSFDANGDLVPGPVTRTFQNDSKILLDLHGTRVTPGHVYYRPDSKKSYKYETLIDVLRDDGVIQHQDCILIRAATNVPVGSPRDGFVRAITGTRRADGTVEQKDAGRIRLGSCVLVGSGKARKSWAVADLIEAGGGVVGEDELIHVGDGPGMPFHWEFGDTLPRPEDFVLACSGTTLEDIYKAAEWESQGPRLPAPMVLDRGPVQPLKGAALSAMPRNEPLVVAHMPTAAKKPLERPNRKQRKATEATRRKDDKAQRRKMV